MWHVGSQSFKATTSPVDDLSFGLLSCLLNTCKKYYSTRLPVHSIWPFQMSEPTSNKPTKTIHQDWVRGQPGSGCWLTDNCTSSDKELQRTGVFREGYWSTTGLSWTAALTVSNICECSHISEGFDLCCLRRDDNDAMWELPEKLKLLLQLRKADRWELGRPRYS